MSLLEEHVNRLKNKKDMVILVDLNSTFLSCIGLKACFKFQ